MLGWKHPITRRELLAHNAWLDLQDERPTRSDYYLMQIAQEVRRLRVRNPGAVQLEHLRLYPKRKDKQKHKATKASIALAKSTWMMRTGYRKKGD